MARVQQPHTHLRNPYTYEPRTPGPAPTPRFTQAATYYPSMSSPRYPPRPSSASSAPSPSAIPRMPGPPFPRPFDSTGSPGGTGSSAHQERRYEPYRRPIAPAPGPGSDHRQETVHSHGSPHLQSRIAQGTRQHYEGYHQHSLASPLTHSRHLSSSSVIDVRRPVAPPPSHAAHARHHSSLQQQQQQQQHSTRPQQHYTSPQQHFTSPHHHHQSPHSPHQQTSPHHQHQAASTQPPRVKAYETNRPTEVYQPSRGAQRDAKWHKKYTERAHLLGGPAGHGGRVPPPHPGHQAYPSMSPQASHASHMPILSPGFGPQHAHPNRITHAQQTRPIAQPQPQAQTPRLPPATHAPPYLAHPSKGGPPPVPMDQLRREQAIAIATARKKHQEATRLAAAKEENDRKVRRIQLQVFVHARTTRCLWSGCEAVLNSWALLEKHVHHCHLHPNKLSSPLSALAARSRVHCQWATCTQMFDSPNDCYQHVLVGHMGAYSARCPFNCLFEGAKFPDLMAHIGRRHPNATPDDFVPGLIHHRPSYIPPEEALPRLPRLVNLSPHSDKVSSPFLCGEISGSRGEISTKVRRSVMRGSTSGRRPRKEHFVDKQGASAAITAIIENSRRIFKAYHSARSAQEDGVEVALDPPRSANVPMTTAQAMEQGVALVDVRESEMEAMEDAKEDVRKWERLVVEVDSDTTSTEGSRPVSRSTSRRGSRVKLGVKADLAGPREPEREGELSGTDSEVSAGSDGSEYRSKGKSAGLLSPERVKRSERLKRKAEEAGVSSPTTL